MEGKGREDVAHRRDLGESDHEATGEIDNPKDRSGFNLQASINQRGVVAGRDPRQR